jgi:nitroreductase
VHRLEKGLIMRPFRVPFAKDYILETTRAFAYLARRRCAEDSEDLRWAADVLRTYFERAGAQRGVIEEAREIFQDALLALELASDGGAHVPYPRGDAPLPVTYEPFAALCQRRRSVRWYQPGPVPRELVDRALAAALQSPSACNRQSFQFRFFDDPQLISAIANIPGGTKGYADSLPGLAVVIGKLGSYPEPRDRHVIYIDGALASMSFMLALETLGLSSCAINWPDVASNERAIEQLLRLAPDERVILLIGFGVADPTGLIPFSAKKPLSVMRRWNDEPSA